MPACQPKSQPSASGLLCIITQTQLLTSSAYFHPACSRARTTPHYLRNIRVSILRPPTSIHRAPIRFPLSFPYLHAIHE